MKKLQKIILPVTATALFMSQSACKKELTITEKLIGEWNIDEADGDITEMLDNDYEIHLEFHLEGDFEFSFADKQYKYSYIGEWEWANSNMDEIEMTLNSQDVDINLKVDTFEGDEISGEMEFSYDGDSYDGNVDLERVYIDNNDLITKSITIEKEVTNPKQINKLRNFLKRKTK